MCVSCALSLELSASCAAETVTVWGVSHGLVESNVRLVGKTVTSSLSEAMAMVTVAPGLVKRRTS